MRLRAVGSCILLLFSAAPASAELIFDLTVTSEGAIPDGPSYGTVKIEALDLDTVRFTVDPDEAVLGAGPNFGVQEFAFNFEGEPLGIASFDGLPEDWETGGGKNISLFGRFDFILSGSGSSRQDVLVFAANTTGLFQDEDSLETAFSGANEKGFHFAAHIADFTAFPGAESAHFGDGNFPVPEPSSLILLGASIAALALARRKKRA